MKQKNVSETINFTCINTSMLYVLYMLTVINTFQTWAICWENRKAKNT